MKTTYVEVAAFLESVARRQDLTTYGDIVHRYPDLPTDLHPWPPHPLSAIFGELDHEDSRAGRPLRTALVVTKKEGVPGNGFFEAVTLLRGTPIAKSDRLAVWSSEVAAVHNFYRT